MGAYLSDKIELIAILAIPFLLAVTLSVVAQAHMARRLGDPTPGLEGRLSVNPLRHVDPFGTLMLPLLGVLAGIPILLGYAKPINVNSSYFADRKKGEAMVSLAGPLANLGLIIAFAYMARIALGQGAAPSDWVVQTAIGGMYLNAIFTVFSLLPIPPFPGSRLVALGLSDSALDSYDRIAPFGFFILLGIILLVPAVITVPSGFLFNLFRVLVGVPL